MTRIINLRQARKSRARHAKRIEADANAALHGESRAVRDARRAELERAESTLDQHRRDPEPEA